MTSQVRSSFYGIELPRLCLQRTTVLGSKQTLAHTTNTIPTALGVLEEFFCCQCNACQGVIGLITAPKPNLEEWRKKLLGPSCGTRETGKMYWLQLAKSLLLLALAGRVRTYNVDDRARTVITSGLSASSAREELFGFSIAHHRYSNGSQAYVAIAC